MHVCWQFTLQFVGFFFFLKLDSVQYWTVSSSYYHGSAARIYTTVSFLHYRGLLADENKGLVPYIIAAGQAGSTANSSSYYYGSAARLHGQYLLVLLWLGSHRLLSTRSVNFPVYLSRLGIRNCFIDAIISLKMRIQMIVVVQAYETVEWFPWKLCGHFCLLQRNLWMLESVWKRSLAG